MDKSNEHREKEERAKSVLTMVSMPEPKNYNKVEVVPTSNRYTVTYRQTAVGIEFLLGLNPSIFFNECLQTQNNF